MFTQTGQTANKRRRDSLIRYWSSRYLAILFAGLLVIGLLSLYWMRHTDLQNRLAISGLLAEEIADRLSLEEQAGLAGPHLRRVMEARLRSLGLRGDVPLVILDRNGRIAFSSLPGLPPETQQLLAQAVSQRMTQGTMPGGMKVILVSRPITAKGRDAGTVVVLQPIPPVLQVNREFWLLVVLLGTLALIGWGTIYALTRRMAGPIRQVSAAAKQISRGDYRVELPEQAREEELHTLIVSFRDMSERLEQLEKLRTELLAGVTHELKTPVASISSLLAAIKDGVAQGPEAEEFLDISMKEAERLRRMVADLLDFNAFASGAVKVSVEQVELLLYIRELVHQWTLVHRDERILVTVELSRAEGASLALLDPGRVQQIITNLLNNASQSLQTALDTGRQQEPARIQVLVDSDDNGTTASILVRDNGPGIAPEERPYLFERFFRGKEKKHRVRGLGLGLAYSRMLARAMGGELTAEQPPDEAAGACFRLRLRSEGRAETRE